MGECGGRGPSRRVRLSLTAGVALVAVAVTTSTATAAMAPHHGPVLSRSAARTVDRHLRLRHVPTTEHPPTGRPVGSDEMPVADVFGPTSVWEQKVSTAPVAASSAAMVKDLVAHITDRYGGVAAFNAHQFTTSFYTAPAATAVVNLAFDDCQDKGYTPAGLVGAGGQFTGVPIPADAQPAAGTDHFLAVYSPSKDQLWEFWEANRTSTGWSACWGGRIDHVSSAAGYFTGGFGASGSGLAVSAGVVGLAEVRAGAVPHALALVIPDTAAYPAVSYPAQRTDGGDTGSAAIPTGTRLRLDPKIDVDAIPGLTPIARIIAHCAQTYGFIVTDTGGAVAVTGESGAASQAATGVDPWAALEGGVPDYEVLANFPWSHLQALPQNWGRSAS